MSAWMGVNATPVRDGLALGRHRSALVMLESMVAAQPLRERRWAQRMLALYRERRQPDVLEALGAVRRVCW